jgi:hypothetical protein
MPFRFCRRPAAPKTGLFHVPESGPTEGRRRRRSAQLAVLQEFQRYYEPEISDGGTLVGFWSQRHIGKYFDTFRRSLGPLEPRGPAPASGRPNR